MLVLQQMGIFFALILIGVFVRRRGYLDEKSSYQLTFLVVNVTTPAMLLSPDLSAYFDRPLSQVFEAFGILLAFQFAMTLAALVFSRCLGAPKDERPLYSIMYVFTNVALIGVPVVTAIFGNLGMFYMSLFIIINNVCFFSYGAMMMCHGRMNRSQTLSSLANPCLIAALVLLAMFLCKFRPPEPLQFFLERLGCVSPALSMILIGSSLANIPLGSLIKDPHLLLFALTKMLVFPVVLLLAFKLFIAERELIGVCMVIIAAPTGVLVAMLATLVRQDYLPLATRAISLTSAVAVLTLPAVSFITQIS